MQYFSVVAEESSLRRAAERLFIAQPPLSRQIKQLEERLGVALFVRHSKGLTLTSEGMKVLKIIQPLLAMKEATFRRLREEVRPEAATMRVGFTTAFEQGVFAKLEAWLHARYGARLQVARATSPKLAKDVRKGRLDAAFVALPLDAPGLSARPVGHAEPFVAALPAGWAKADTIRGHARIALADFTGRPLFWFKRENNPAFFDYAKAGFALAGFAPRHIAEPAEHDVLLARVASGEGMGLFAASFAAIRRDGVVFADVAGGGELHMQLGIVTLPGNASLAESLLLSFSGNLLKRAGM